MRTFSLDGVQERDRAATLTGAFAEYPFPLALELTRAGRLRADFDRSDTPFGTVEGFHVEGASGVVRREPVTDSAVPELVTLHLERGAHVVLGQDGRFAEPRPGDAVLSSTRSRFTTQQDWVSLQRTISIDANELGFSPSAVERATAIVLDADDPVFGPISRFFSEIANRALSEDQGLSALRPVVIEMMRVLIATVSADETRLRPALALTLGERVVLFIDLHLLDPELTASMIARAHAISVRYLYVLLRQQSVSLGDYIRAGRIAHARGLISTQRPGMTLAEVAQRSGFSDYSSFARVFRSVCGSSPREFRELAAQDRVRGSRDSVRNLPTTAPKGSA